MSAALDLHGNSLTGTIPSDLGLIPRLGKRFGPETAFLCRPDAQTRVPASL
jgi:hypothetical protein